MPRLPRFDRPGTWHHVMNRGLARRTVFETRADIRMFLALLAREVRRKTIEVHAFSVLTTHVHLLVRSPRGALAEAMQRVFNGYVRYFNRGRRRDGSLFRGRYRSRPVESRTYRLLVVIYIDRNAVEAGLARRPHDYPYGSAKCWATGRRPPWLAEDWLAEVLRVGGVRAPEAARRYAEWFGQSPTSDLTPIVEGRLAHRRAAEDPLDDLVGGAPERVRAWMKRKAALADQTKPGLPLVSPAAVLAAWRTARPLLSGQLRAGRGPARPLAEVARVALLRDLSGLTYEAIAAQLGTARRQARLDYLRHAALVQDDPSYARTMGDVIARALGGTYPRMSASA
jgi:REP element-mobilizing transposase RayT